MDISRTGEAQLHSITFWGVFPNITEPILDDENNEFLLTRIGSQNGDLRFF